MVTVWELPFSLLVRSRGAFRRKSSWASYSGFFVSAVVSASACQLSCRSVLDRLAWVCVGVVVVFGVPCVLAPVSGIPLREELVRKEEEFGEETE